MSGILRCLYIGIWLIGWMGYVFPAQAVESYRFRVYLKEKGGGFSVDEPERFLSSEAIVRRERFGIPVTAEDLPIAPAYLEALRAEGATPVVVSKWLSTVVVEVPDRSVADRLLALPMVDSVRCVWRGESGEARDGFAKQTPDTARLVPSDERLHTHYGYAQRQIKLLNGIKLHRAGFRGEGMRIAVIDAGFSRVNRMSVFDHLQLLGTHNVVFPGESVFEGDDHGTKVLSCLAADCPGVMVGTAPEASYWLIKSEDGRSEYPIEEDYWAAAVEYADSVGVDMITSSLGYFVFDEEEMNHSQQELDGKTAHITRAACRAAAKGILLFCSAGNEGNGSWRQITFPADAEPVVAVGAVTEKKQQSLFSSVGPTADQRVKPDLVAMGTACCVIGPSGSIQYASGTSFATPILAGLASCLWQALPNLTPQALRRSLREAGSRLKRPDVGLGYGIPDVYMAYKRERKYAKRTK